MNREKYVNEAGQPIVHKQIDPKKASIALVSGLLIIAIITFIIITVNKSNKNKTCNNIEDAFIKAATDYAREKNIMPTIETESITVDNTELNKSNSLNKSDVMFKGNACTAIVTITKYKDTYISNATVKNCGYCTTDERYGPIKESSKLPKGNVLVTINPTFNYYETTDYNTPFTNYYTQDYVSKKVKKNGVYILEKENLMPRVPEVGHVISILKEDKIYYRYRDKKWKFYKNPVDYSNYSSTQPTGYSTKDVNSSRLTDWTSWSLNYPDKATYRTIKSAKGYRWYYKEDGKEKYWNSGAYSPDQPGIKYTSKDSKTAMMYSYQDSEWRWYNGSKREYTSYYSVAPRGYGYRDDENISISSYSLWYEESKIDASNSYYREQETEVRSRYRIKYQVYSLLKLDQFVYKQTFEQKVGKSFKEFATTPNIKIEIEYKYNYRKAK